METLRKLLMTNSASGTMTSTPMMTAMLQKATSRRSTLGPRRTLPSRVTAALFMA